MKKELKNILKFSREILDKQTYKKLKKIKDDKERIDAAKYVLISSLENEHHEIEREIRALEEKNKDIFFVKNKSLLIPSKIRHFKSEFSEKEYSNLRELINRTKEEIKNV